ncbi:MAG: S8 family serine peptidase, partial [Eubacteriales bacterium]|nr:S8 family serine peptidase [Eubacteriales bacterium]
MAEIIRKAAPAARIVSGALQYQSSVEEEFNFIHGILDRHPEVRIVNMSYNAEYSDDYAFSLESATAQMRSVINRNVLLVKSRGNDDDVLQYYPTAVARVDPKMGGILFAAAAERHLSPCGGVRSVCITTPSYFRSELFHDETIGSSNSAALVSATAALVWSRYPWMNAQNVQQVILGTADDAGKAGVDELYGWGILNPTRAVNGYGALVWGQSRLNVEGVAYFNNNLFGEGGLDKYGSGLLVLNGDNRQRGSTNIYDGSVVLNGRNRSDVAVMPQGTLISGDRGYVSTGSLKNKGRVYVQDGDLHVHGDFINKGEVHQSVGRTLYVDDTADLDGHLFIDDRNDYVSRHGNTFTALKAKNILGRYVPQGDLEYTADYAPDHVDVSYKRRHTSSVAQTIPDYPDKQNDVAVIENLLERYDGIHDAGKMNKAQKNLGRMLSRSSTLPYYLYGD